ncbi:MAG: helix-turn-helix domain-containing protein [Opitutaceae bacterium]|nr:helix-turn-helix domain-containing protein [Opitutaceae bacterium]
MVTQTLSGRRAEGFPGQRLTVLPPPILARARRLPFARELMPAHLGRFDLASGHYVDRPRGSREHILMICLQGCGYVETAQKKHMLDAGCAILLPPNRPHRYWADDDRPWSLLWVHFVGAQARHIHEVCHPLAPDETAPFHLGELDRVVEGFEEIYRHVGGGFGDSDLIGLSTGATRLVGLLRTLRRAQPGVRREAETRVLRAIRHMRENLAAPLTLGDLAGVAGWAPSHFATIFRRQTQVPPLLFLTRLRLHRACELLKAGDEPIASVGASVGFADAFYFSRVFSRHQGLSPAAYRRLYMSRTKGQRA